MSQEFSPVTASFIIHHQVQVPSLSLQSIQHAVLSRRASPSGFSCLEEPFYENFIPLRRRRLCMSIAIISHGMRLSKSKTDGLILKHSSDRRLRRAGRLVRAWIAIYNFFLVEMPHGELPIPGFLRLLPKIL